MIEQTKAKYVNCDLPASLMAPYWSALPYLSMHMYVHRGSQGILLETTKYRSGSADFIFKMIWEKNDTSWGCDGHFNWKEQLSIWKEF